MPTPIHLQIVEALVALFQASLNTELAYYGVAALPSEAFAPIPAGGDIVGDAITVSYAGNQRGTHSDPDNRRDLRLTESQRDNRLIIVVELWAFAGSDQTAQAKAIVYEAAVVNLLDQPAHRYLGGLLSQPVVVGPTTALTAEDEERASMFWHSSLPLACRVRTNRPEHA